MADTASPIIRDAITTVGAADPSKRDFLKLLVGSSPPLSGWARWRGRSWTA